MLFVALGTQHIFLRFVGLMGNDSARQGWGFIECNGQGVFVNRSGSSTECVGS